MQSYISAYMMPGKAKIAIQLIPFQLHRQPSHDRMFIPLRCTGLWHVSDLTCGNSPVRDPGMGHQSSHVDFAENIDSTRTEIMSEAQMNGAVPSSATQTIFTNDSRVACNGGGGPLGHPQVWLTLGGDRQVMSVLLAPLCRRPARW